MSITEKMKDLYVEKYYQKKELAKLKKKTERGDTFKKDTKKNIKKAVLGVEKTFPKKLKNRKVMKKRTRVTVMLNQPVYTKDKARYYKENWVEDERQLFFNG